MQIMITCSHLGTFYVHIFYLKFLNSLHIHCIKIHLFFTRKSNDIYAIDTHEFSKSTLDNLFQIVDYSPF